MTVGFVSTVVNGWLDTTFPTGAGATWVKLHTADPGAAAGTGAAVGDATRKQATMAAASGGSKALTGSVGPWTNAGTSETLSHISIWTASSAGSVNATAALTGTQAWASGNTFTLTALTIAITPIAV